MHQRACVALARAHAEIHKLVTQQRAGVLGMLAQVLLRKLLKLAGLLKKMVDTHFIPVCHRINLIASNIDGSCQFLDRLRRRSCFMSGEPQCGLGFEARRSP
jgi:hypothetical protein